MMTTVENNKVACEVSQKVLSEYVSTYELDILRRDNTSRMIGNAKKTTKKAKKTKGEAEKTQNVSVRAGMTKKQSLAIDRKNKLQMAALQAQPAPIILPDGYKFQGKLGKKKPRSKRFLRVGTQIKPILSDKFVTISELFQSIETQPRLEEDIGEELPLFSVGNQTVLDYRNLGLSDSVVFTEDPVVVGPSIPLSPKPIITSAIYSDDEVLEEVEQHRYKKVRYNSKKKYLTEERQESSTFDFVHNKRSSDRSLFNSPPPVIPGDPEAVKKFFASKKRLFKPVTVRITPPEPTSIELPLIEQMVPQMFSGFGVDLNLSETAKRTIDGLADNVTNSCERAAVGVAKSFDTFEREFGPSIAIAAKALEKGVDLNVKFPSMETSAFKKAYNFVYDGLLVFFGITDSYYSNVIIHSIIGAMIKHYFKAPWIAAIYSFGTSFYTGFTNPRSPICNFTSQLASNMLVEILVLALQHSFGSTEEESSVESPTIPEEMVCQAGADWTNSISNFLATMYIAGTGDKESFTHKGFVDACGSLGKIKSGLTVPINLVLELLQAGIRYIGELTGLAVMRDFNKSEFEKDFTVLQGSFTTLANTVTSTGVYTIDDGKTISALLQDLRILHSRVPVGLSVLRTNISNLITRVSSLNEQFTCRGVNVESRRVAPFAYSLIGGPGVGKSTTLASINSHLLHAILPPERFTEYAKNAGCETFSVKSKIKHWDGYHGHKICVFDDFMQSVDVVGDPDSDPLTVVRMVNCLTMPLPMAELSLKANTTLTAEIVCMTSNMPILKVASIVSAKAVARRVVSILAVVKKEYALSATESDDPRMRIPDEPDWDKIELEGPDFAMRFGHIDFYYYNWETGNVRSKSMSFMELVDFLLADCKKKRERERRGEITNTNHARILAGLEPLSYEPPDESVCSAQSEGLGIEELFAAFDELNETELPYTYRLKRAAEYVRAKAFNAIIALFNTALDFVENNVALTSLAVGLSMVSMYFMYYKNYQDMYYQSGNTRQVKLARAKALVVKRAEIKQEAVAQCSDPETTAMDNVIEAVYRKNHYKVTWFNHAGKLSAGYCTFILGRLFVIGKHYYDIWMDLQEKGVTPLLTFTPVRDKASEFTFKVRADELDGGVIERDGNSDQDLMFFKAPKQVKDHYSIVKFFSSPESNCFNNVSRAVLVVSGEHDKYRDLVVTPHVANYGSYTNQRVFSYSFESTGKCGSLLFDAENPKCGTSIIGIHAAGVPKKSFGAASMISLYEVERAVEWYRSTTVLLKEHEKPVIEEGEIMLPQCAFPGMEGFNVIKCVDPYKIAGKSGLKRTPFLNTWHQTTRYPVTIGKTIRDNELIDPYVGARALLRKSFEWVDQDLVNDCVQSHCCVMSTLKGFSSRRKDVLDFETSITGIPGVFNGIPRSTSAVYPLCNVKSKKFFIFGSGETYSFISPESEALRIEYNQAMDALSKGEFFTCYYSEFLKDEIRKPGKNARLVSCSPLIGSVVGRSLFGRMLIHLNSTALTCGSAVGINPYDGSYDYMARILSAYKYKYDFDHKNWDFNLNPVFMYSLVDYAKWYYAEEFTLAHETFVRMIINSEHVVATSEGNFEVIAWFGMMISGFFATSHVNSLCHNVSNRYVFATALLGKQGVSKYKRGAIDFDVLESKLVCFIFGDDIVGGHNFEEIDLQDVANAYQVIGMTITNADKSSFSGKGKTQVCELEFLKRNFVFEKETGSYIGVLNLAATLEIPMWHSGSSTIIKLRDSVNDMLRELSLHGREVFQHYVDGLGPNSIRKVCVLHHVATTLFEYDSARAAVVNTAAYQSL